MKRRELFGRIRQELAGGYPSEEAEAVALRLLGHYLGVDRAALYLDPEAETEEIPDLSAAVRELMAGRPLQYVLGETEFYGRSLKVNESVLIPRPETEELVRWIAEEHRNASPRIIDIGTGSGAIAIALATELPGAEVSALDISPEALETARENAERNEVRVSFLQCDILREKPAGKFDVIVSNPPYVRESEKTEMRSNVLDHEPGTALFVPDSDPLLFYREIAAWGREALNDGGTLYFEINEAFGPETGELLSALGYGHVEVRKDLFGKDRMARGSR